MRYEEKKQYLLKKSFIARFQRQIYLFTIKTANKHFLFSPNIAKTAYLSFSLPDKIISPRHSAPKKSSTFSANFSTFVSHSQVSRSPCSIANETTPQFTTFGYSSGTKSRKRRKNAPHACQKGLSIYPKMGIALSRESL
jgi:hypothetical protein